MRYLVDGQVHYTAEGAALAIMAPWNWARLANLLRKLEPGTLVQTEDHTIVALTDEWHNPIQKEVANAATAPRA